MERRRRDVLAAALASAGAVAMSGEVVAAQESSNGVVLGAIRDELRALRAACCEPPGEVERIRGVQNTFLRSTGKYPDAIEIGTRLWEVVYDWLRESPHPMDVSQLPNGRYAMRFGFTTLLLRPDAPADFLGNALER
jgi:hypothetical protein